MAKCKNTVLLGYLDELVTEKHNNLIDFTVNKIGGEPNYPQSSTNIQKHLICPLCKFPLRLVVQIYAPLENNYSKNHRTLYLFACINSECWNKSESWKCLRIQSNNNTEALKIKETFTNLTQAKRNSDLWCSEAEDWGPDDNVTNLDEKNCNIIPNNPIERMADDDEEEDESSSLDDSTRITLKNLSIDDKNANNGDQADGEAVARLPPRSSAATAEIEADESGEVITVESPIRLKSNLAALLHEDFTQIDKIPFEANFISYFMSVYPEEITQKDDGDNHVAELLNEYQKNDEEFHPFFNKEIEDKNNRIHNNMEIVQEEYEKCGPLHGDKIFHHFLTKIKNNPEQILRYNREGNPLLIGAKMHDESDGAPGICRYCKSTKVFEFQLISTIITKLQLTSDNNHCNRLEFGTVLIYTCKNSCWDTKDAFREETVFIQREIF